MSALAFPTWPLAAPAGVSSPSGRRRGPVGQGRRLAPVTSTIRLAVVSVAPGVGETLFSGLARPPLRLRAVIGEVHPAGRNSPWFRAAQVAAGKLGAEWVATPTLGSSDLLDALLPLLPDLDLVVVLDPTPVVTRLLARLPVVSIAVRGFNNLPWAILGEAQHVNLDVTDLTDLTHGPAVLERLTFAPRPNDTTGDLVEQLCSMGATALPRLIRAFAAGNLPPRSAKYTPTNPVRPLTPGDGALDWGQTAWAIADRCRALHPWPRATARCQRQQHGEVPLLVGSCSPRPNQPDEDPRQPPGTVLGLDRAGNALRVQAGVGVLDFGHLGRPGEHLLQAEDFCRRHHVTAGDRMLPGSTPRATCVHEPSGTINRTP